MSGDSNLMEGDNQIISENDIKKLYNIDVKNLYYSPFPIKRDGSPKSSDSSQPLFFKAETRAQDTERKTNNLTSKVSTQLKLQSYYRKAVEYRIANSLEASAMKFRRDIITSLVIIMSTAVSVLLLYPTTELLVTIGALISALVSALSAFSSFMEYSTLFEKHSGSVAVFANLQRTILNLLHTGTEKEQQMGFVDIAEEFAYAINIMPMLDPRRIQLHKSYNGNKGIGKPKLFKEILDNNLRKESKANIIGMSRALNLFPEPKSIKESKEDEEDDENANSDSGGELFTCF